MINIKSFLLTLCAGVFIIPKSAYAIDVYALGSYWDIKDADGNWGTGVGGSLPLLTEHLRLDARAYYFEGIDVGKGEISLYPIDLGAQIHLLPNAKFNPYVLGGATYFYVDNDNVDVDSDFGAYIGGGMEYRLLAILRPFAEVAYRWAELGSDIGPSNNDLEASGITANVGLKVHF